MEVLKTLLINLLDNLFLHFNWVFHQREIDLMKNLLHIKEPPLNHTTKRTRIVALMQI
jgi:hypothetical protein